MYYDIMILDTDSGIFHAKEYLPTIQAVAGYLEGYFGVDSNEDGYINGIDTALSIRESTMFPIGKSTAVMVSRIEEE